MSRAGGIVGWYRNHPRTVWVIGLLGGLVLATVGIWVLRQPEVSAAWISAGRDVLVEHPAILFLSIGLLPTAGFPVSVLLVLGGYVFPNLFGPILGMLVVLLAISLNIAITYWIARGFAPWFRGWFERRGYPLPDMKTGTALQVTVLVRVTPGMPLFVQNYMLGLLKIPWRTYLIGSLPPQWVICAVVATGGGAIIAGNWLVAIGAAVFFVLLGLVLRRVYQSMSRRSIVRGQ